MDIKDKVTAYIYNNKYIDEDFWEDLESSDIEEVIEEYVRDCSYLHEWVD